MIRRPWNECERQKRGQCHTIYEDEGGFGSGNIRPGVRKNDGTYSGRGRQ